MKKMKTLIVVFVGILFTLLIAFLLFRNWTKGQIMDGDGMIKESSTIRVSYYQGGSSLGELYRITLEDNVVTIKSCQGNGYPTEEKSFEIYSDIYYLIDDIVYEYGMNEWENMPKSEEIVLDAASTSLTIDFRNGKSIKVSSDDILPDNGWEGVNKIVELLEETTK